MRRAGGGEASQLEAGQPAWEDDRLAKPRSARLGDSRVRRALRMAALTLACYLIGMHELVLALFTKVDCMPSEVQAGANVTCMIATGRLSSEVDLSITQTGAAGPIALLSEAPHAYKIAFATTAAGAAGVRVSHSVFWSSSSIDVLAAPAEWADVSCAEQHHTAGAEHAAMVPAVVAPGATVHCSVTPRDRFGNPAEVQRPSGAPSGYFAVSAIGGASQLAVHDTYVSFVAGMQAGRAGVAITLNGARVERTVQIGSPARDG